MTAIGNNFFPPLVFSLGFIFPPLPGRCLASISLFSHEFGHSSVLCWLCSNPLPHFLIRTNFSPQIQFVAAICPIADPSLRLDYLKQCAISARHGYAWRRQEEYEGSVPLVTRPKDEG